MLDDVMRAMLMDHSVEMATPDKHYGTKRSFTGTKASIVAADPKIHEAISYRTVCKQTRMCRLGFTLSHGRTDLCDYCYQFDTHTKPVISKIMNEAIVRLRAIEPRYWDALDIDVAENADYQAPGFCFEASPAFLKEFGEYMRDWNTLTYGCPASTVAEAKALGTAISEKFLEPGGWLSAVEAISTHWRLRDNQQQQFNACISTPEKNHLYVHMDMEDSTTEKTPRINIFYKKNKKKL